MFVLVHSRLEPAPVADDTDTFSVSYALDSLRQVLGPQLPHPVGSREGEAVAERIAERLTANGLEVQVLRSVGCSPKKTTCGFVTNVLARLDPPAHTDRQRPAVLVSAHHDSVAAGPGAGDDGAGVATLIELAHRLADDRSRRNPIYFAAVDGEEEGLLGAYALMDDQPWASDGGAPAVAVNLDAGGTRGVTSLTRTSAGNAAMIDVFAQNVTRPHGSSVIAAAYGLTPYDTDFTAYSSGGLQVLDLGFGEDKTHYHTPLDRLEHLDPASVGHLGNTALGVVSALARMDLDTLERAGDQAHVDVLGWALWHLPTGLATVLALLAGLGWAAATVLALRAGTLGRRSLARACVGWPLWIAAVLAAVTGLCALAAWAVGSPTPAAASPLVLRTAMWGLVVVATVFVGLRFASNINVSTSGSEHSSTFHLWWAGWLWLTTTTVVLGVLAPAACVATLGPALLASGLASVLGRTTSPVRRLAAMAIANLFAAAVLIQGGLRMEWIFGLQAKTTALVLAPICILTALQLPLWCTFHVRTRKFLGRPVAGLACLAYLTMFGLPARSTERPRRLNLVIHQHSAADEAPSLRALIAADRGPVPQAMLNVHTFLSDPAKMFPWIREQHTAWIAPLQQGALPPPKIEIVADDRGPWGRRLVLRLLPTGSARSLGFVVPESVGVRLVRMAGKTVPGYPDRKRKWYPDQRHYRFVAPTAEGVELELVVRSTDPLSLTLWEVLGGVPNANQPLAAARPTSAVPSGGGDQTVISHVFEL